MMMKKTILTLILVLFVAGTVQAATEAEKRAAIDNGLAWLATQQNANGSIGTGGTDYLISQTGASILAFMEEKANWGTNAASYQTVVNKGVNYLMSNAQLVNIVAQPAGNPDGDGNGKGVYTGNY